MLHSRYIVVEDFPDNTTRVVYNGASSIEAQKAMGKSIDEAQCQAVLLFSHPNANQVRYPAREKQEIIERAEHAKKAINAETVARQREATLKRANAARLISEADALEGKAVQSAILVVAEPEKEADQDASSDADDKSSSTGKKTKKKKNTE